MRGDYILPNLQKLIQEWVYRNNEKKHVLLLEPPLNNASYLL